MSDEDLLSLIVPAAPTRALTLLVPGGLTRCSGRYRYDRQIVQGLRALGWTVGVTMVDASFPQPTPEALDDVDRILAAQRDNALVMVDGLVLGAIPEQIERVAHRMTIVGLVHHLLAAEAGLDPAQAADVAEREGQALRAATGLIAPSFGIARAIVGCGVQREQVAVVIPGTDAAPRAEGSRSRPGARRSTPVELVCVGSLIPRKGHDVLLDAVAELRLLPWHLTCVGSDTVAPDHVTSLREQIEISGLADQVTLAGEIDDPKLEHALQHADVFVLATQHEGYGMAVAEALRRGIPVVSTMAGAIPELVGFDGGSVVPIADADAFAAALEPIVGDHARRAEVAAGALAQGAALPLWSDAASAASDAIVRFAETRR
ncbi:MAG: glycosyltransferase family 4 protein [Acidobacteria bacterium]|nr:glycosyltransferase family 4 protein [Acidobacteriota bacterium]